MPYDSGLFLRLQVESQDDFVLDEVITQIVEEFIRAVANIKLRSVKNQ